MADTQRGRATYEDLRALPDNLAGWRRERIPKLPEHAYFTLAPDWGGGVLSPSTAQKDRLLKMTMYASNSVDHCWRVDPDARSLEAFLREGTNWLRTSVFGNDERVTADPFAAAPFGLGAL